MASRQKRIEAIQAKTAQLAELLDVLIEEMETGIENMPINMQESPRAEAIQEKIDTLQGWSDALGDIADEVL